MYYCISAIMLREKDVRAVKFNVFLEITALHQDSAQNYQHFVRQSRVLKVWDCIAKGFSPFKNLFVPGSDCKRIKPLSVFILYSTANQNNNVINSY